MDSGKEQIFKERRSEASKTVRIKFLTSEYFSVMDEEGNHKYTGSIYQDGLKDSCECVSFVQGNTERYMTQHSKPFLCKHLIRARFLKFDEIEL